MQDQFLLREGCCLKLARFHSQEGDTAHLIFGCSCPVFQNECSKPLLIGSLASMPRVCGKAGCKCSRGELHPGLYLAPRVVPKRKMIHVPQSLEAKVRQWVGTYQEVWRVMEEVSQACYQRFFQEKQQVPIL